LISSSFLILHCAQKQQAGQQAPIPEGGVFRVKQYPVQTVDPTKASDFSNSFIINQVFEGLIEYDVGLNLGPALSDFWTIDSTGVVYRFHLRHNVYFQNGHSITAQDVIFTFERLLRADFEKHTSVHTFISALRGYQDFIHGKSAHISGITSAAPDSVQFTLRQPVRDFLLLFASDFAKILPADSPEAFTKTHVRSIAGAGPFFIQSWTDSLIVLRRFPRYYRAPAHIDSIVIHQDPDYTDTETLEQFRQHTLDFISAPYWALDSLQQDTNTVILSRTGLNLEYIGMNNQHPILKHKSARYALAETIDWDSVYSGTEDFYIPATSIIPPGLQGFEASTHPPKESIAYRSYFRHHYYSDQDSITFSVIGKNDEYYYDDYMLFRDWKNAGVPIQLHIAPWEEFSETISDGSADIFSLQWIVDIPSTAHYLFNVFHSDGSGNYFHYSNSLVDSLLDQVIYTTGIEPDSVLRHIINIITDDLPFIPVDYAITAYACRPTLRGLELSPFGGTIIPCEKIWYAQEK